MSDINKGYTFTDKSTDWASNKETAIRLNKMLDDAKVNLVAGTNITITPTANGPSIAASGGGTGTVTSVNLTAGTSISVSGGPITTSGSITVNNTAPDQVVSLTGAGTTTVTGTYPNFTVTSNDAFTGTVTSVSGSGGTTGLTLTGGPITGSGTLTLGGTLAVANGGTGTASPSLVAGTNVTISGSWPNQTITSTAGGGGGTVTAVTGTAPIVSSGGTAPDISINAATTLLPGSMSAADKAKLDAATNANTANAIVSRDVSGNFNAGTITANITGNVSGSSGSTTGNAATATALQTARAINGVNFDGTAAITVTAAGSTLSDTVPIGKGGTGQTTANTAFNALAPSQSGNSGKYLTTDGNNTSWAAVSGGAGGTVTSVSVTTANGVSGVVATPTITPAITLTLGAITPTSVAATGAVSGSNLSGTNTGDQTNISGNAATVTTNANLTGPITSVGNATSVASQTGTGSTFVMQASPTLTTPALGTPTSGLLNSCTSNPSGTGSVPRTFQARAGDVFNVKDFGATGDYNGASGGTADEAAINAAAAALVASDVGGCLYFPAGRYKKTTKLTMSLGNVLDGLTIKGDGPGASQIVFVGANLGIDITVANPQQEGFFNHTPVDVMDLAIATQQTSGAGTAFVFNGAKSSAGVRALRISNVSIRGFAITQPGNVIQSWDSCISVTSAEGVFINNVYASVGNLSSNTFIVKYDNGAFGSCSILDIGGCSFQGSDKCVWVVGTNGPEGVIVRGTTLVNVNWGVYWDTTMGEEDLKLSDSHINSYKGCVYANNLFRSFIHDNNLFVDPSPTTGPTNLLRLGGARYGNIHDNFMRAPDPIAFSAAAYIAGTTYAAGDRVSYLSNEYTSLVNSNTGT